MEHYCRKCGSKLLRVLWGTTYDPVRGRPIKWFSYPCPNYKWWALWTWSHKGADWPRKDQPEPPQRDEPGALF